MSQVPVSILHFWIINFWKFSLCCLFSTLQNDLVLKSQQSFIFDNFGILRCFFLLTLQTNHAMKIHSRNSFLFHTSNKTEINSSTTRNIYIKTNNWKWHLMSLKTTLLLFNAWSLSWNSHLHGRCIIKRKRDSNSCFGPCL